MNTFSKSAGAEMEGAATPVFELTELGVEAFKTRRCFKMAQGGRLSANLPSWYGFRTAVTITLAILSRSPLRSP
jgi:hypothetical protein